MSFSSEEELDQLLTRQIIRRPRKFEERWLFDVQNPTEFREISQGNANKLLYCIVENFRLPVDAFIYILEF